MWKFCNDDLKLVKHVDKVPLISKKEFIEKMKEAVPGIDPLTREGILAFLDSCRIWIKDLNEIVAPGFSGKIEIWVTSDGLPVIISLYEADYQMPFAVCVYWNGTQFKGFIPRYGNTFNFYTLHSFGFEGSEEGYEADWNARQRAFAKMLKKYKLDIQDSDPISIEIAYAAIFGGGINPKGLGINETAIKYDIEKSLSII